jgi:hypothetical protein
MIVIFRYDGRKYRGKTSYDILIDLMLESHDRTLNPAHYMRAVARRIKEMYGRDQIIRTDTPLHFLHDLVEVGAAHSITKLIGGTK